MAARIEDYGLIGDLQTAALVSRQGCVDWLCLPRFDSGACFAALLGDDDNGHWSIAPAAPVTVTRRRYRGDTLILETEFEAESGTVRLIDFMPPRQTAPDLVRIVEGVAGSMAMRLDLTIRPTTARSSRGSGARATASSPSPARTRCISPRRWSSSGAASTRSPSSRCGPASASRSS